MIDERIWRAILLLLDILGLWLLLAPDGLIDLLSARRVKLPKWHLFLNRVVGAIALWTQVDRWEYQAKNGGNPTVLHGLSYVTICGTVGYLGYQFVRLFTSDTQVELRAGEIKRWELPQETEEEARARYTDAWRRYRRLRVALPLTFLGGPPLVYALGAILRAFHWNENVASIIILAWVPLLPVLGWKWSFWQCPRCGQAFKSLYQPLFPKRCQNCELPMWAVDPRE